MNVQTAPGTTGRTTVCWGTESAAFELRTSDANVLARAAVVFRPWASPLQPALTRTWTVEPADAGGWIVRGLGADGTVVTGHPGRVVTLVEYLALQALLDGPPDVLTLHAGLVSLDDRGVLILGPSEAGKSTLACGLWQAGFSLLGDDVAIVESYTLFARSGPKRVSLRTPSRELLGADLWDRIAGAPASERTVDGHIFHPDEVDGRSRARSVRIAACLFLAVRGARSGDDILVRRPPAQAALALLPYSNLVRRFETGDVLDRMAPLAAGVPIYDLGRRPLATMVSAVQRLLEGGAE